MALSVIRSFTTEDQERLDASAQRFANRYGLTLSSGDIENLGPAEALDHYLWSCDTGTWPRIKKLKRLWQACRCRALGFSPSANIDTGYGYVGHSVS